MIVRVIYIALILVFSFIFADAQSQQVVPIYTSKNLTNNTLIITCDSGRLAVTAYKANVIKVQFFRKSDSTEVGEETFEKQNIRVTQNLDDVFFATDSLWVIVNKLDLSIRFLKKQDEELLLKNESYFLNNPHQAISFLLNAEDKPLFREAKKFKSRAKRIARKESLRKPILISPKGYALLIQNPTNRKVKVSETANHQVKFEGKNELLKTFYFLNGDYKKISGLVKSIKEQR